MYGHRVQVITDHTAVKAILGSPNPSGRHARWWTRVFGQGIQEVSIIHSADKDNLAADALSRSPHEKPPSEGIAEDEVQVAAISSTSNDISTMLNFPPCNNTVTSELPAEQKKDHSLMPLINYLQHGTLPLDKKQARIIAAQAPNYCIVDDILYFIHTKKRKCKLVVVPWQLQKRIMLEYHGGLLGGHYSGNRLYNVLITNWYWDGMYNDALEFCRSCPQCAIVTGGERHVKQPLHPIPVQRIFQIIGLDIMDLLVTEQGNKHVIAFPGLLF